MAGGDPPHGGRLHVLEAQVGRTVLQYSATIEGTVDVPVDATGLAPRPSMLWIGTGRDAVGTAKMLLD